MQSHPIRKRTAVRISPPLPAIQNQIDLEMCKILIEKVFDLEKDITTFIVPAV
jgi:ABC-type ATPase with predicted acetyltransferase domain